MGIFDSIKSAFSNKAEEDAADSITVAGPEPAPSPARTPETAGADEQPVIPGESGSRTYTVQSGDTLWKISLEMYGDGERYLEIFEANSDLLTSPDQIFPGQELVIPAAGD